MYDFPCKKGARIMTGHITLKSSYLYIYMMYVHIFIDCEEALRREIVVLIFFPL